MPDRDYIIKKAWGIEELTLALEALEMLGADYTIQKALNVEDAPVSLFEIYISMPEVAEPVFEYED